MSTFVFLTILWVMGLVEINFNLKLLLNSSKNSYMFKKGGTLSTMKLLGSKGCIHLTWLMIFENDNPKIISLR